MKNKELKNHFAEYMENLKKQGVMPFILSKEDPNCILLGEEDFHVNKEKKTIYLKPFKILLEDIEEENLELDWLAIRHENPQLPDYNIIVGFGNPYGEEQYDKELTHEKEGKRLIVAVPFYLINHKNQIDK